MENNSQTLSQWLQPGDLLFQLCKGGDVEWTISRLFEGIHGQAINHVAIYIGDQQVVEATAPSVQKVSLDTFLKKSVVGLNALPCLTIGRLIAQCTLLIPSAIEFAENCIAHPYNATYGNNQGWYCSQLVVEAFKYANGDQVVFEETPMSFRDPETGELFPYWINYYKQLGMSIPEGKPGSHPALLSRSDKLEIITTLGSMPQRNLFNYSGQADTLFV